MERKSIRTKGKSSGHGHRVVQKKEGKGVSLAPPPYGLSCIDHALPVQRNENKTGMPDKLKSGVESLSGMDMSDVRVHHNSAKPMQFNALAYAQGNQIHLGPGQEKHLPHEAWHVVQQKQGRVSPTLQLKGAFLNNDKGLESEADVMGVKAIQQGAASASKNLAVKGASSGVTVQAKFPFMFENTEYTKDSLEGMSLEEIVRLVNDLSLAYSKNNFSDYGALIDIRREIINKSKSETTSAEQVAEAVKQCEQNKFNDGGYQRFIERLKEASKEKVNRFDIHEVTTSNFAPVLDELKKWQAYAKDVNGELTTLFLDLNEERKKKTDYYSDTEEAKRFRARYKRAKSDVSNLSGSASELGTIIRAIEGEAKSKSPSLHKFRLAYFNGTLQGVMEVGDYDSAYVSNLGTNPRGIFDSKKQQGNGTPPPKASGAAQALLEHLLREAESVQRQVVELWALNNTVQLIYHDALKFESYDDSDRLVKHPAVESETATRTKDIKKNRPEIKVKSKDIDSVFDSEKQKWKKAKGMRLSDVGKEKLKSKDRIKSNNTTPYLGKK